MHVKDKPIPDVVRSLSDLNGPKRAALLIRSVDQNTAKSLFSMMSKDEIKKISKAMSELGVVEAEVQQKLISHVIMELDDDSNVVGNIDSTEAFLSEVLDENLRDEILNNIKGPEGNTVWEKLGNMNAEKLFSYIKNEHVQTIVLVVSKLPAAKASKILSMFDEEKAVEVMSRIPDLSEIDEDVLWIVEDNIRDDVVGNVDKLSEEGSERLVFDIFNNFNKVVEAKMMKLMQKKAPELAKKIEDNMFTFDNLKEFGGSDMQILLKVIDKSILPVALKGANDELRSLFLENMSERAAKIVKEDMSALGPIRMSDVDSAQSKILTEARNLIDKGEIVLKNADGEEMVE